MLRCIHRESTDPYFNIAAEEYLLQHASIDTFMVWVNEPSVIIGKHQNAAREINHDVIQEKGIPVIRRITGGGTVYHDPGNINFSFIRLNRKENPIDFKFFTFPVITFLKSMGLAAEFEGKSNVAIEGLKVSGNSAHVYKGRVLHHGTLLFDTDLETLQQVTSTREEHYLDRSVRSIRKKVCNISSHIAAKMEAEDFKDSFFSFMINHYKDAFHDSLNKIESEAISLLAKTKYRDNAWNYGYSPDYQYSYSWSEGEKHFLIELSTREAIIDSIQLRVPEEYAEISRKVEKVLTGSLHEKATISARIKILTFNSEKEEVFLNQIIQHLF